MLTLFPLKLYTTTHCHLCEQALELILQNTSLENLILIEIANDDALLSTYGTRIPVLQRTYDQTELDWPFNADSLIAFLKE